MARISISMAYFPARAVMMEELVPRLCHSPCAFKHLLLASPCSELLLNCQRNPSWRIVIGPRGKGRVVTLLLGPKAQATMPVLNPALLCPGPLPRSITASTLTITHPPMGSRDMAKTSLPPTVSLPTPSLTRDLSTAWTSRPRPRHREPGPVLATTSTRVFAARGLSAAIGMCSPRLGQAERAPSSPARMRRLKQTARHRLRCMIPTP